MRRNQIGLHVLFAILGLGASLLLLGVGAQFMLQMQSYDGYQNEGEMLAGAAFCVGGVACLIFSIGLIMQLEWARIAFQVLLILGGIAWLIFIAFIILDNHRAWAVLTGMGAVGTTVVLFGVLFLEHPYFRRDLQGDQKPRKEHLDILDQ